MKRKSLPTGRDFLFVEGYGNENPGAFQSTRPMRGATSDHPWRNLWAWVFQPTRPLRGATRTPIKLRDCFLISTHAPLAGRDRSSIKVTINKRDFNPRAPCGARPRHIQRFARAFYFNPRAPCGARQLFGGRDRSHLRISTHAPLAGRDNRTPWTASAALIFQPTRPLRGATASRPLPRRPRQYFNPRAPCGARPGGTSRPTGRRRISTHAPLAGRDLKIAGFVEALRISTHAPLAGRDGRRPR